MNTFDFYTFSISLGTSYKRKIGKLGISESMIRSHKSYVSYGHSPETFRQYPKFTYTAVVGYMDAPGATSDKVDAYCTELEKKYGMPVHPSYIARD